MIGESPFPSSIAELTPEVLGAALDTTVVSFTSEQIGADRGMLGEIFVVTPVYAQPTTGPITVVCKFAALREQALASAKRGGPHERELRCYDELLGGIDVSTPHFYAGWYDPDTAHFLLVQEALDSDLLVDQVAGISAEQATQVIGEAARLHHAHWNDTSLDRLTWLPRLDDPRRIHNLTTLATNGWQPLCDLLGDDLSSGQQRLGAEFPARLEAALRSLAELPSTLIHSDLRADNLLFNPNGPGVWLIDWQGAGIGPGSFDVAYLLSHSLTANDRRVHETELIERYRSELAQAGTLISHDEFMAGYRLAMHYGLAVACALPLIADTTLPRVRTLARSMALRSLAALEDHDQLW